LTTNINIADYLGIYQESVTTETGIEDVGISCSTLCYCWKKRTAL
jgi:hypothetical protein